MSVKIVESAPSPIKTPPADPFPYGWRQVAETLPDGRTAYRRVPLTAKDFLNPQLGDHMPQGTLHARLAIALFNMLHNYYLNDPTVGVFFDLKMCWGIPDLEEPAPDIAVVPHLQTDKEADRGCFDVVAEGTRPSLVIEVSSPNYPGDDTDKVRIYRQAGVAEYIIINRRTRRKIIALELKGYRLVEGAYKEMVPDAEGCLFSETTGLYFELSEDRRRVFLFSAATGEQLLTADEEKEARELAQLLAAQQAEIRELVESQVAEEAEARQVAETRAVQAETRAVQAETRAAQAESQVAEEAAVRQALEAELAQLRAQLKQSGTPPAKADG
jgi:Uma2 family endonuclease